LSEDSPGVVAPPPLIFLGGFALGFLLEALLPSVSLTGWLGWGIGVPLALAGAALAISFVRSFRRARTPVDPYATPRALVTAGPYRLTRNPGYLGMALVYAGICFMASALWGLLTLVTVLVVIDRGVVAREERILEKSFGEEYRRYRHRVRRWI
jgi:protein-S-isoprenylcysteine O-methyltransferase Ste14